MENLNIDTVKTLESMELPKKWTCVRAEVEFRREGWEGDYAGVVYDARNKVFYARNQKCTVYPGDEQALVEAIEIMERANRIAKSIEK